MTPSLAGSWSLTETKSRPGDTTTNQHKTVPGNRSTGHARGLATTAEAQTVAGDPTSILSSTARQTVQELNAAKPVNKRDMELVTGLKRWIGRVLEIDDEYFTAELISLDVEDDQVPITADFATHLLAEQSQDTPLAPGDAFYLTNRTIVDHGGLTHTTSHLRLRRLGNWTKTEIFEARASAKKRLQELEKFID